MKNAISMFAIVFASILLCSGSAKAGDKPKVVFKMTTLAPKNSAMANVLTKMDKEIREKSNNEAGMRVYYGGVQGDEKEAIQKIKFRQLHGGMFTASGLHRIVPAIHILSIPYLFRNYKEVTYIRNKVKGELYQQFLKKGYVVIAWGDAGFAYQFSKVAITSNDIAKKQKFWQWGDDPVSAATYKTIGVTPVSLSLADVMTSLSTRLIDAAAATPSMAVAMRWYTKFKYMSEYPNVCVQGATIVRKDQWDKLTPETQKLIKGLSQKYYDEYVVLARKDDNKAIQLLKKAGVQIVRSGDEKRKQVESYTSNISKKVREALVGKLYSQDFLNNVTSLLNDYRAKHPESKVVTIK